ncbi:MAG: hypothetical protein LBJ14_00990 [Desulfarculales bacterium]|jgi:hypothetical protein|nr:hypothetical protein [Desulfarculales bacterium]
MKVIYSNHTPPQPGYGIFRLSEVAEPRPGSGRLQFMLKRSSDQKNLSAGGWQEAEIFLEPLGVTEQEGVLDLQIGPEIVDALDMREVYRFYLNRPGASRPLSAVLRVTDLLYSPLNSTAAIKAPPPAPAPSLSLPAPGEEPLRMDQTPAAAAKALPQEEPSPPENICYSEEARPCSPPAPPRGRILTNKKRLAAALAALLLLLSGGGSLYYFLGRESVPPVPPLQQAYQHLTRENPDPEAGLQLALTLRQEDSPDAYDAAFLLFEDAAHKNNAQAMIFMGEYYDPLDDQPNGSIIKDSEQAFAWYGRALQAGEKNAETKLDALRKWMDENEKK